MFLEVLIKSNYAIDRKVLNELPKNNQELFAYLLPGWESLPRTDFYKSLKKKPRIGSAVVNAPGGFFD